MSINILLFFLILFFKNILSELEEKILFAFQMNRHGARAPYLGVTNGLDVYKEKWLKNGELSDIGKRQLYLLGVKVRKRYIEKYNLLSENYNPQEIYIKSTDSNRTIISTYSFLQGLYPSGTGKNINNRILNIINITYPPNKKYQKNFEYIINKFNLNVNGSALPYNIEIIPTHLFYIPDHDFKLYDSDVCKGLIEKYEIQNNRKEIHEFADELMKNNKDLFINLEKDSTNEEIIDENFLYNYWNLYKYMDSLVCDDIDIRNFSNLKEKYSNESKNLDDLKKLAKKFLEEDYIINNNSTNMSVVDNSYTMHSLLNWMENAINNYKQSNNKYIKYVIYSSHDSSIGTLEGFTNYAFNTNIEYAEMADSRFFELYINTDNKFKVRYLRGNSTVKFDVDYDDFKKIINEKTWSDEQVAEFCQFEIKNRNITPSDIPKKKKIKSFGENFYDNIKYFRWNFNDITYIILH